MRKTMILAALTALFVSAFAFADDGNVLKVSGIFDSEAETHDGNPETFTTLKRNSPAEPFVIYVYLAELLAPDRVVLTLSAPVDGGSVQLSHSADIVGWDDRKFKFTKAKDGGRFTGTFEMEAVALSQYLRIKFNTEDKNALDVNLYEISSSKKDTGKNKVEDVRVVDIEKYKAAIEYKTKFATTSQMRFSEWRPDMNRVLINQTVTTDHRMELSDLLEGTEYYYQVLLPEQMTMTKIMTFRTEGKPLPIILEINLSELEPTRAQVLFKGNTGLNWKLYFGEHDGTMDAEKAKSNPAGEVKEMTGFVDVQGYEMVGLKPRTRYYFLIEATDDEGRKSASDLHGFDTPPLNLALGKPVVGTFRSELEDPFITPTDNPMGRVTDGDETYMSGFAKSMIPDTYKQFVMVDLGEPKDAAEVVVAWSRLGIPEEYTVQIDNGDQKWETVLEVTADGKKPEVAVTERQSLRGDPLVDVTIPVNRKFSRVRLDAPMGVKILSKFEFGVAILAELKVQAP